MHPDSNEAVSQSREEMGRHYSFIVIMLARDPNKTDKLYCIQNAEMNYLIKRIIFDVNFKHTL